MKKILVMKFGGTSLMTAERIKSAAQIVSAAADGGQQIVVVVSAMGHATDELIELSNEISTMPNQRELDALMATGEQVSATLMTMALQALGCKARSFNGMQAGITTDRRFGNAEIEKIRIRALCACLNDGCIPVVTGFQGITVTGETTTLGRGGSDTTAIALASALKAERCDIYTDVDGIYSADPRIIADAARLDQISVFEMLELARNGAQVLNARSVEIARDRHVAVRVRSTFHPADEGTLVTSANRKFCHFTGLAMNRSVNCIEISLENAELGPDRNLRRFCQQRLRTKRHLSTMLLKADIKVEILGSGRANLFRIPLIVSKSDTVTALAKLHQAGLSNRQISVNTDLASVVLVAPEITAKHQADAQAVMAAHKIPVLAIGMKQQRLTVLVPLSQAQQGLKILHSQFAGSKLSA